MVSRPEAMTTDVVRRGLFLSNFESDDIGFESLFKGRKGRLFGHTVAGFRFALLVTLPRNW